MVAGKRCIISLRIREVLRLVNDECKIIHYVVDGECAFFQHFSLTAGYSKEFFSGTVYGELVANCLYSDSVSKNVCRTSASELYAFIVRRCDDSKSMRRQAFEA